MPKVTAIALSPDHDPIVISAEEDSIEAAMDTIANKAEAEADEMKKVIREHFREAIREKFPEAIKHCSDEPAVDSEPAEEPAHLDTKHPVSEYSPDCSWKAAANIISDFRVIIANRFHFKPEYVIPVRIGNTMFPLKDSMFDVADIAYEVKDGKLTCLGKVSR